MFSWRFEQDTLVVSLLATRRNLLRKGCSELRILDHRALENETGGASSHSKGVCFVSNSIRHTKLV